MLAGWLRELDCDVDAWQIDLDEAATAADAPGQEVDRSEAWGVVGTAPVGRGWHARAGVLRAHRRRPARRPDALERRSLRPPHRRRRDPRARRLRHEGRCHRRPGGDGRGPDGGCAARAAGRAARGRRRGGRRTRRLGDDPAWPPGRPVRDPGADRAGGRHRERRRPDLPPGGGRARGARRHARPGRERGRGVRRRARRPAPVRGRAPARTPTRRFGETRYPYGLSIGRVEAGDWASSVPDRLVADGRYGVRLGEPVDAGPGRLRGPARRRSAPAIRGSPSTRCG